MSQGAKSISKQLVISWVLMMIGLVMLGWVLFDLAGLTYSAMIWHVQNLPAGETIPRSEAAAALRSFQLETKDLIRGASALPLVFIIVGAVVITLGGTGKR